MRGNFPLRNRTLHFAWMSVLLSKQVSPSGGCGSIRTISWFRGYETCFHMCLSECVLMSESILQWVTSWWQSESLSGSLDPGILFPFQEETHQQRAGGPTREDSHWKRRRDGGETTWIDHPLALRLISFNRWNFIRSNPKILTCLAL